MSDIPERKLPVTEMNSICYKGFLLAITIGLGFGISNGQLGYSAKKYRINTIVPENQVKQIEKDKNGFYWILTTSGRLIRWNGNSNFRIMNMFPGDTTQPANFGLCRSDGIGNLFFDETSSGKYYYSNDRSNIRLHDTTNRIVPTLNYFGDYTEPKEKWEEIEKQNDPQLVLEFRRAIYNTGPAKYILHYTAYGNGFYLFYQDGFLFYKKGKIQKVVIPNVLNEFPLMVGNYLMIKSRVNYTLYHGTMRVGEGVLPEVNNLSKISINQTPIYHTAEATYVAVGLIIYKITIGNNKLRAIPYFKFPDGYPSINCFNVDEAQQRIVVADISGGFVLFTRNYFFYLGDPNLASPTNTVYALLPAKNKVYISYDIYKLITQGNVAGVDWHAPPLQLKSGDIFYPSAVEILLCDKNLRIIKRWPGPSSGIVQSAIEVNGRIFYTGKDLYEYLPDKMAIDTIHLKMSPEPNGSGLVRVLAKGPPGILYASIGNDIYEIKLSDYSARGILKRPAESTYGTVKDMRYDAEYGVLFLSLRGQLCYIDPREGIIRYFPLNGNRDLQSCHYMLRDNDGDCWLPTNTGLFFLSKENLRAFMREGSKQLTYVPANIGQNGQKEEFNSGYSSSGVCAGDSIYLSSMRGVVIFSAREAKRFLKADNTSRILIDKFTVDDQPVENITNHIILPAGFKRCEISVDFAFNTIFGAGLEYQLLGLGDTTMQLMYDNNKIVLQNLYPGKYQLRVQVVNHPEVPPLILNIEAAQYWYKTRKAIALWFLLAGLLLWVILSWRIQHARNAALEEVDKSRKELFTIISHDLRSPLKAYQGLAEVISHLLRKGDYERVNRLAQQIDSTGAKLDLLLDNLLNWNVLQQEKLIVKNEKIDIAQLMNEHIPIYQAFCLQKNINILFEYRNDCMAEADKTMVALMIRNLLDNAIKNSLPGQNIIVDVFPTDEQCVEMVISNSFQEKDREKLKMISSLIRKKEKWDAGSRGMGFGLRMVYLAAIKSGAELTLHKKDNIVSFVIRFKQKS